MSRCPVRSPYLVTAGRTRLRSSDIRTTSRSDEMTEQAMGGMRLVQPNGAASAECLSHTFRPLRGLLLAGALSLCVAPAGALDTRVIADFSQIMAMQPRL